MSLNRVSERMMMVSPTVQGGLERESTTKDFEIQKALGAGAYGKVYRCKHKSNGSTYAVKQLSKKIVKMQKMEHNICNEIKIMYTLEHQNIIRLFNHFEEDEFIYLVLEYAQDGQLWEKLHQKGPMEEKEVQRALRDIVEGLQYLHQHSIIHRDIKPENLLISGQKIKLGDFGWSTFFNAKMRQTYCGTLEYLAPEMIEESGHDWHVDIWSLGILTFELLTGRAPFLDDVHSDNKHSRQKLLEANILNNKLVFPEDFPPLARDLCNGLLRKEASSRLTLQQIKDHPFLSEVHYQLESKYIPLESSPPIQEHHLNPVQGIQAAFDNKTILRLANGNCLLSPFPGTESIMSKIEVTPEEQAQQKSKVFLSRIHELEVSLQKSTNENTSLKQQLAVLESQQSSQHQQMSQANNSASQETDQLYSQIIAKEKSLLQKEQQISGLTADTQKLSVQLQSVQQEICALQERLRASEEKADRLREEKNALEVNMEMHRSGMLKSKSGAEEDVGALIKQDLQGLLSQMDSKISSYREVASAAQEKDSRIMQLETEVAKLTLSEKTREQELTQQLTEEISETWQDKLEAREKEHRQEVEAWETKGAALQAEVRSHEHAQHNEQLQEESIKALQKEVKNRSQVIETREGDWEISKIYIKKLETEALENQILIKNLNNTVAYMKRQKQG